MPAVTLGNALQEAAQMLTFGAIQARITKAGLLEPALDAHFKNMHNERNWLVHKSQTANRNAIFTQDGAQKLLPQVDAMVEALEFDSAEYASNVSLERH